MQFRPFPGLFCYSVFRLPAPLLIRFSQTLSGHRRRAPCRGQLLFRLPARRCIMQSRKADILSPRARSSFHIRSAEKQASCADSFRMLPGLSAACLPPYSFLIRPHCILTFTKCQYDFLFLVRKFS
jgi:hypothetical protein